MNLDQLKADLILASDLERDEGDKLKPYTDIKGNLTIGIGRNLIDPGLSQDEVNYLFQNDLNTAILGASTIPGFDSLTEARQRVLVEMCFNMGIEKLDEFHNMLAAIERGDIQTAHDEILNSDAARELPDRYARLAETWLNG